MPTDKHNAGTYRDPCPKCGARLLGMTKAEYVEHLRENGETLAARIEEEMVVSAQTHGEDPDCAGANRDEPAEN